MFGKLKDSAFWLFIASVTGWLGALIPLLLTDVFSNRETKIFDNDLMSTGAFICSTILVVALPALVSWLVATQDARDFHRRLSGIFAFQPAVDERLAVLAAEAQECSIRVVDLQRKLVSASIEEEAELKVQLGCAEALFRANQKSYWTANEAARAFGLQAPEKHFKASIPKKEDQQDNPAA